MSEYRPPRNMPIAGLLPESFIAVWNRVEVNGDYSAAFFKAIPEETCQSRVFRKHGTFAATKMWKGIRLRPALESVVGLIAIAKRLNLEIMANSDDWFSHEPSVWGRKRSANPHHSPDPILRDQTPARPAAMILAVSTLSSDCAIVNVYVVRPLA